jgi:putative transposase
MKTNHSFTKLTYHFVFVTKYRKQFYYFQNESCLLDILLKYFDEKKIRVVNANFGDLNHIHILLDCHPSLSVSDIAKSFKYSTNKYLSSKYTFTWPGWQTGYYCGSVGANSLDCIENYIKNQ